MARLSEAQIKAARLASFQQALTERRLVVIRDEVWVDNIVVARRYGDDQVSLVLKGWPLDTRQFAVQIASALSAVGLKVQMRENFIFG